jgi:hypothetical protein
MRELARCMESDQFLTRQPRRARVGRAGTPRREVLLLAGIRSRLTYANIVSTLCLFLLLGGGAYAAFSLPRNSVKSKHIVNRQVKGVDLARPEAPHVVGTAGEPAFSDGGQGDCVWSSLDDASPDFSGYDPVSFFKDGFGIVHLSGIAVGLNGSGGDGLCKSFGPGSQLEDGIPFILPPGYRPTGLQTHETQDTLFWITPAGGAEVEGLELPGSVVLQRDSGFVDLDGITYRPAS